MIVFDLLAALLLGRLGRHEEASQVVVHEPKPDEHASQASGRFGPLEAVLLRPLPAKLATHSVTDERELAPQLPATSHTPAVLQHKAQMAWAEPRDEADIGGVGGTLHRISGAWRHGQQLRTGGAPPEVHSGAASASEPSAYNRGRDPARPFNALSLSPSAIPVPPSLPSLALGL